MAYTTYYYSTVKTLDTNFDSVGQAVVGTCRIKAIRENINDKKVKLIITGKIGFKTNDGSTDKNPCNIIVDVGGKADWHSSDYVLGKNDKVKGYLNNKDETVAYNVLTKSVTRNDISWYAANEIEVKIKFMYNNELRATSTEKMPMPKYSSSGGSGGGTGGDPVLATGGSVTNLELSPTTIVEGGNVTATITGKKGQNNTIKGYELYNITNNKKAGSVTTTSTTGTISFSAPTTPGKYNYKAKLLDGNNLNDKTSGNMVTLTVTEKPVNPLSFIYVGTINGDNPNDPVYISVSKNSTYWAYTVNRNDNVKILGGSGTSTTAQLADGDLIRGFGAELIEGNKYKYSTEYKEATVRTIYYVRDTTININPQILKDNLSSPDLVNIISGSANARTTRGGLTYTWEYAYSPTQSGLSNASYTSLGVSGSNFNNIDMAQKVPKGNYYRIKVTATNTQYYTSDSAISEIYQIPSKPGRVTSLRVIPKADPEDGYTEIIKDGKAYFGSGLFLIWNNPTITSSQMPISNIELLYKVKNLSSSDFSEPKTTQFRFSKVLEPGALIPKDYFNDKTSRPHTTSGTETGGGNVLEANSLAEVQVGIRITDTLGEYEDTWYESKTYYKSESPQFGGNLIAKQSSFRPFTCVESERFTLNSSVGASNSQDALLYNIECHVDDRKIDLYLIDSIPISTKKFNSAATDAILYPDNALGNEDIIVRKQDATTIRYEIKNKYFKDILLREKGLRTPKNNLDAVYNDDFTNVTYKIYVQDDFDATSNIYSSGITSINFIEAPNLKHNNFLEIGINRYTKSINPFYDNSIIVLDSLSNNNDRIVNPGESIIFKFKRAKDYNAADYLTTMVGDVSQYNIYVSRNDDVVFDNYDKLNYTLLKSFNAALVEDGGDLKKAYPNDSNDEFYYLEYPLQSYQESKFVVFKIEAVDSRNRKSEMIYSNTYLVPCRATAMDYHIGTVNLYTNTDFDPKFSTKVNDFGASKFINTKYSYKDFPNYERTYSVGVEPNKHTFTKKAYLIIEGSLDSTFEPGEITLEKEVKGEKITKTFSNKHFSFEIDFANLSKGKLYIDILNVPHLITNFPNEWEVGIKEEFIKKIFFKSTYKIAYGFKDVEKTNFDERYLYISSVSAPYSYYEDSPTVSYRNHQVGINTKDFSAGSKEGQKEVLIIQDNGSYNLVVFKGAEQKIILNLTERTFTATTDNNKEVIINFGTGLIDGMTIDGGGW